MNAIIETGGKQYRVETGAVLEVEKLEAPVGEQVTLERVLAVGEDEALHVGQPVVLGARVLCTVLDHGRGPKIRIFNYKAKDNIRRRKGHRQSYTRLRVDAIETGEASSEAGGEGG